MITLVELGKYLAKVCAADEREDIIRKAINAGAQRYCGREFDADANDRAEDHIIEDDFRTTLVVRKPPIISVTSILSGTSTPQSTIDSTSYLIDKSAGIIRLINTSFTRGSQIGRVTVNYKGGYAADDFPDDLKLALLSIMAREVFKADKSRHGMSSRQFQGGGVEYFKQSMEESEKLVLDLYVLGGDTEGL